ncbi:hypothetical protein SAMN05192550_2462 [Flavobacterium glycines]|uniref:Uncharacterized protein n=1 Tax=Flavobacterium glycines TaxID=551990 RepID=A0A1B9DG58_9FLAO|nr:hypothetical protein [Flavobacterium glycines]OCB68655.1 hypothetical protein FBGL_15775 [Flavobacterium glycines]GEL11486.1 hypothetical protein FGL01_22250 [Flavobacterium glycines]SDJ63406.1 hypothetical protein SAMN05192550_2462 [Flavobacterium glycines]
MDNKNKKLILGIVFDIIGMLSFSIPFIGEFSDVVWAPLSGFLMTKMYKGRPGRISGIISFVEEFFPFTDFIPTFTLMWIYNYSIKKND